MGGNVSRGMDEEEMTTKQLLVAGCSSLVKRQDTWKHRCVDIAYCADSLAANLAFDEAVMTVGFLRRPMFRTWRVEERAIALGFAGRVREEVVTGACEADGVRLVRRRSGGGSVVQGPEVQNVSFYLPADAADKLGGMRRAQEYMAQLVLGLLESLAVAASFHAPADIACGGRKLVGSAIWRVSAGLLYQASLIIEPLVSMAERYLAQPKRQPDYRRDRQHADFMTSLEECGVKLTGTELAARARRWFGNGENIEPTREVLQRTDELARERYGNDEWNHRR